MFKIWFLTMGQNSENYISDQFDNIYPTFNGLVALCNQPSNDKTELIYRENKGEGVVLIRPFIKHHGHLMSELFYCGHIRENDWCLYMDSAQKCTNEFINILPDLITEFENKNIEGLIWDGRIYLFKYNLQMRFNGACHWYLEGYKTNNLITLPEKEKYIINKRDDNKNRHYLLNPCRYYFTYGVHSNEVLAMYSKYSGQIVNEQENIRREFLDYLQYKLNLNLENLDDLLMYLHAINNDDVIPSEYFLNRADENFRMIDLFRHKILGQDLVPDIVKNRYNWRLSYYLKTRDREQLNLGYEGYINQFNRKFGFNLE